MFELDSEFHLIDLYETGFKKAKKFSPLKGIMNEKLSLLECRMRYKPEGVPLEAFMRLLETEKIDTSESALDCMANFLFVKDCETVKHISYSEDKCATEDSKEDFKNKFSRNVFA